MTDLDHRVLEHPEHSRDAQRPSTEHDRHSGSGRRLLGLGAVLLLFGALAFGVWRHYTRHVEVTVIAEQHQEFVPSVRVAVVRAYVGERANRRHKPGRALERVSYRFDILSDYGAFRDLQRHRMLTLEWQPLSPRHGYAVPAAVSEAGLADRYDDAMARSAGLYDALVGRFPAQAPYAVSLAYRVRYAIQLNAREAMHMLELRTTPQGHPDYRAVCQEMHRLIATQAGHPLVAETMRFVDHGVYDLERLDAERRAEARRTISG